jgi:predicted dehydrogenase
VGHPRGTREKAPAGRKALGINAADAMAIIEAARESDVFLMEAFMYRAHPQTARLVEILRSGAIGEVRMIQGAFGFHWPKPWNATSRIISNELAGGGILDVGCYPVSMSRLIAGVVDGHAVRGSGSRQRRRAPGQERRG